MCDTLFDAIIAHIVFTNNKNSLVLLSLYASCRTNFLKFTDRYWKVSNKPINSFSKFSSQI